MTTTIGHVIATLNSIQIGDLERIAVRLQEARGALQSLAQEDLVQAIDEAGSAIRSGNVPLFRKRLQHVVSRLGHLR